MTSIFIPPKMTRTRMIVAMTTALAVDVIQVILGPLGVVTFLDDFLDLVAAAVITMAVGFHPLLLPTFVIEVVPVADLLPTWTGCTLAVLALRKRAEGRGAQPQPPPPPDPEHMKRAKVTEDSPN